MLRQPTPALLRHSPRTLRSIVVPSGLASAVTAAALDLGGASPGQVVAAFGVGLVASVALHLAEADRQRS